MTLRFADHARVAVASDISGLHEGCPRLLMAWLSSGG